MKKNKRLDFRIQLAPTSSDLRFIYDKNIKYVEKEYPLFVNIDDETDAFHGYYHNDLIHVIYVEKHSDIEYVKEKIIHEIYHLVCDMRETIDNEEYGAYLMGYLYTKIMREIND